MATYYVRISGSDSNAGTSAAAAWRTIGKALGSSGISSGDTVYIGAGTYREAVTVAMTSPTAETKIIGDVSGQYTGDAGEVIWSGWTVGDISGSSSSTLCNLNGRKYLTFENLSFITTVSAIRETAGTSTNITVRRCFIHIGITTTGTANGIDIAASYNVASTVLVENCIIVGGNNAVLFTATTSSTGADYNLSNTVRNCVIIGSRIGVCIAASGTATYRGNGVSISNCSFIFCGGSAVVGGLNISTTYTTTIANSLVLHSSSAAPVAANVSGSIVDSGANRENSTTAWTLVPNDLSNRNNSSNLAMLEFGQSWLFGFVPRMPFAPYISGGSAPVTVVDFGNKSGTSTDLLGQSRPSGGAVYGDSGTATAGASTTLTDSGKTWGTNQWLGWLVRLTGGTGSGQVKRISSNTATALTISGAAPAGGQWATTPDSTSTYLIYQGPQVETGKATAGAATTLTDSNANWAVARWAGYTIEVTGGTGSGQTATVTSNTATALTVASWSIATPDNTSTYALYWPGTSLTATQPAIGALEVVDSARLETTTTDSGNGIRIDGPGYQTIQIPVTAASTTISVRARYDSNHGTTNKPQALLLAQGDIGVSAETLTMTSAADTWETLTFTAFTPSATGVVRVQLVSRSATPYGRAFFDTVTVS